jgi:hypothetical protein
MPVMAHSQDGILLNLGGKWPYGANRTMAISDTIGFYPCGEVLITLNLTDPINPTILKQELFHELVTDVLISNDLLFIAFNNKVSIRVYDGSPHSTQLSNLEVTGRIINMIRVRNLLFIVENSRLTLFDLMDPENPLFLNEVETDATLRNLSFYGSFAYGSTYDNWIAILDFSDSLNIQLHPYFLEENSFISYVAWRDSFLYVGASRKDSILVYTLEDPLVPFQESASYARGMYGITFYNDWGIISAQGYGILIYDFSDPLNPEYIKSVSKWSEEIHLSPPYFLNQNDEGKIDVYDLSDISNINHLGHFSFGSRNYDFALDNQYAYIAQAQRGIAIIDVSDNQAPYEASIISIEDDFLYTVSVEDNYCFIGGDIFYIYDITNPLAPTYVSEFSNQEDVHQIFVQESYAYLNQGRDGVLILDISDLHNPVEIAAYTDVVEVDVIYVVNNTLFVSDDHEQLLIIDVSDKLNPTLIDSMFINRITGITVENNYLYLSRRSTGFTILDITDPHNPDSLYSSPYAYAFDLVVREDTLFLLDRNSGPRVYDVSDKGHSRQLGSYYYKGSVNTIGLKDNYLYMLDAERGLKILKMEKQQTVGMQQYLENNSLLVFPNPARNRCTIELTSYPEKNSMLTLYDVNGSPVYRLRWPHSRLRYEMPIESLPAGVFFVEIGNASNQRTGKLVVLE